MDADKPHVVHLDTPSMALNGLRLSIGVVSLGTVVGLAWWATNGDPAAAWASRFRSPPYVGIALITATILLVVPMAMVFRSISLAWIAVALLAFIGVWLFFSIGLVSFGLALLLAPAVWLFTQLEKRHRTTEPIDPVEGHPSQP